MRQLKKVFDLYIYCNFHVALASFCLTKLSLLYWGIEANLVPYFVFFSTVTSYNYIRLTRRKQINTWFSRWLKINKVAILIISVLSGLACVYILLKLRIEAFYTLIPFAFLTGLYVIPKFLSKNLNLRNLPAFKIFIISLSWAGITVLFPLMQYRIFNRTVFLLFIMRFLFVVTLTLPFDLRDYRYDLNFIKTLPILLGVNKVKIFGIVFLVLYLMFDLCYFNFNNDKIDIIICLTLAFLLLKSSIKQSNYFSSFWVEGIPILWLLLYYLV